MNRYRTTVFYVISYLVIVAVAARGLGFYFFLPHPRLWLIASLLAGFALLTATESRLTQRLGWYPHIYLGLQKQAHRQLQEYAAQAEELAITQERNRLARDLHYSISQTLFSMSLTTRAIRLMLPQNAEQAATQLDRLQALAESALVEMRSLIAQLRPSAVEAQGFIPALRQHLVMRQSRDNLSVALQVTGESPLSSQQARNLFGVVQEALNNVVKHAQTDQASVRITLTDEAVHLLVQDEGIGFDLAQTPPNENGMGLASMRERAETLGGTLSVITHPGAGTKIQVDLPLTKGEMQHEREN